MNLGSMCAYFVGQKSPSRMCTYNYTISNPTLGVVTAENNYIVEKTENELSSDVRNNS